MHLRSSRVCVQIASVPLVRLAPVTASQKRHLSTAKGNCQGKNFIIPKVSQTKRKGTRGRTDRGHDQHRPYKGCQITHTTYKYFLGRNTYLFDDPYSVYIFTIQTPRQYDNIPRPDGNSVIGSFHCLSGEQGIDTFVYSHICVRVVSPYQANLNRCDFA